MESLIKELIEKRAQAWEAAKGYWESEERTLTAEDAEAAERANTEITELDKRINELHSMHLANKAYESKREEFESILPKDVIQKAENRDRNMLADFAAGRTNHMEFDLRFAVDVDPRSFAYQLRDLGEDVAAAGGNVVPTSFRRVLYEHMIESAAIRQTNVTILNTASGEALQLPRTGVYGTATWTGEGTALTEADPTFGQITLNAWKVGQLLQVSNELLTDSGVDISGFMARDLGRALGQASGARYVTGSGTLTPRGVITAVKADVGTAVQIASATVETDNLIDLFYDVIPQYRSRAVWFMADGTEAAIRKKKNSSDEYVWQPALVAGTPNQLLGRPVIIDPNVAAIASAAASVAFGDFSGFIIRDSGAIRIERSDDYAFNTDQVTLRSVMRTDSDLIDVNAIDVLDTD